MYVGKICKVFIFDIGRKSFHSKYDVRVPDPGETVFYSGPDERRRSALSSVTTWSFQRTRGSLLCLGSHFRTRTHAQSLCSLQGLKGMKLHLFLSKTG
jgi:hypothetical protein